MNSDLDYALVKLPTDPTDTYGYLQLRQADVVTDERLYVPQYPGGGGKRLAVEHEGGHPFVCGRFRHRVLYVANTYQLSSGSPVLAYDDHAVIALHTNGSCPRNGIWSQAIIDDLGADLPADAIAGSTGSSDNTPPAVSVTAPSAPTEPTEPGPEAGPADDNHTGPTDACVDCVFTQASCAAASGGVTGTLGVALLALLRRRQRVIPSAAPRRRLPEA